MLFKFGNIINAALLSLYLSFIVRQIGDSSINNISHNTPKIHGREKSNANNPRGKTTGRLYPED